MKLTVCYCSSIVKIFFVNQADEPDEFVTDSGDPDYVEKAKIEAETLKRLQNLFKDCKFFLNREVPRESLTFIIRYFACNIWQDIYLYAY